ncbi:flagellar basal body rod protein FlgC [Chryseomicrobium excrementi]|uniref:Flagellar basal-body rod protein FlgC n=1 Tax=Chryseomicrobium excrementi TaxID=2041346 RepID=A0A2M9F0Q6_9BACL|nr:flagellar basal body rod protein FlgC [Chryseomicrobium excrementi]PJK17037.1 flagellar basal body rod protein FlgC [Chryseomicrobium excrementi]
MSLFGGMNASASGLTVNRLRMDVVSANIANAETTRGSLVDGEWVPYRRKVVELESFEQRLHTAMGTRSVTTGVTVDRIKGDKTPFQQVFDPEHPDANEAGYVLMPNVDPLKEMVDLMSATRSYEANVTAFNASKGMFMKALEIGK